ncbi:hypothetical protein AKO1_014900 [Acrasis kona]|uniref:Uncharacterized protein n=1 Tax=Acrasis kona TaxID=1008807 RepID=A0AAW2Z2L5_9EUKA
MISYIRENTGAEKIDFMGASQGAGQAMASICEHPDMKNMFNTMILSCPAMFIQKEPKQFLLRMLMSVPLASLFGSQEFFMLISVFQLLMPLTWLKGQMGYSFMKLMGFIKRPLGDKGSMKTRARWFQWIPVGCTSVRNLTHWMEVLKTGGALTKLETNTPYKFEDMLKSWDEESKEGGHRPNVMVLLANEDCVIDNKTTKDVFERCYSNCEGTDRGECKVYEAVDYGHIDFIWSEINSTKVIYDKVQKFLLSHN